MIGGRAHLPVGRLRFQQLRQDRQRALEGRRALFGQLAGTLYGIDAIPTAWRAALLRRDLLESTAQRLLSAAAARPG